MSNFKIYDGKELFEKEFPPRGFIIENIIKEKDTMMVVGTPKAGKSLFTLQLVMSVTSGEPFLGQYEVKKPLNVLYVASEGEIEDWQNRMRRMHKYLDFDISKFKFNYTSPLSLHKSSGDFVKGIIGAYQGEKPGLLILDPVYMMMIGGSLSDDGVVREFNAKVRVLKDVLGCSVILVHHTRKPQRNKAGEMVIEDGTSNFFGSQMFYAFVDHMLYFDHNKKDDTREFACTGQRSGDIVRQQKVRLIEPDPLYFELAEDLPFNKEAMIFEYLKSRGQRTWEDIVRDLDMSKTSFFRWARKLKQDGRIATTTSHERPVYWHVK